MKIIFFSILEAGKMKNEILTVVLEKNFLIPGCHGLYLQFVLRAAICTDKTFRHVITKAKILHAHC